MLIGAHVSTAGGLSKSIDRAQEIEANAIQIFNQSPRMWRPTNYSDGDFVEFREKMAASRVGSVVIHAVYLINCASKEPEIREKSLASLTQALRVGDGIAADGVVLHPGSCKGEPLDQAMDRVADALVTSLSQTSRCPVLLENTAGAGGTIGRDFKELAGLAERVEGLDKLAAKRIGICLDSCHLFASGFEVTTPTAITNTLDQFDRTVGIERLRCIHLNDSKVPFGSHRDRHENLGEGEIGEAGLKAFLGEPRLECLPAILEVPGPDRKGPDAAQVATAKRLYGETRR